LKEATPSNFRT